MLIFGHPLIDSEKFYRVGSILDIKNSPNKSLVLIDSFRENGEIIKFCQRNLVPYSLRIFSIKEAICANALDAKYIIAPKEILKDITKIAEHYLFDTKVLVEIGDENEIEDMAKVGVDGVILTYESR